MVDVGMLQETIQLSLICLKYISVILELLLKTHPNFAENSGNYLFNTVLKTIYDQKENILEVQIFYQKLIVAFLRAYGAKITQFVTLDNLKTMVFQ